MMAVLAFSVLQTAAWHVTTAQSESYMYVHLSVGLMWYTVDTINMLEINKSEKR